jgi:hypothetical protein
VHASLDNHSDRIRLSSDSRYQLAAEPTTDFWVYLSGEADLSAGAGIADQVIVTDPAGYRALVNPDDLDLLEFRRQVTGARKAANAGRPDQAIERYQASLDLWRGPALNDVDGALAHHLAALEEERLQALEERIELQLAAGVGRRLVPELSDLVVYEAHIGTFTPGGTFDATIEQLPRLRDLGINALVDQIHSSAIDILRSTGMDRGAALQALWEVTGRTSAGSRVSRGEGVGRRLRYGHRALRLARAAGD